MSNELKLEHLGQELHEIDNGISNWEYKLSALGRLRSTPMTPIEELEINRELKRLRARKREIEAEQVAIYDQMERDQTQHRTNEKAPQGEIKREGQGEQQSSRPAPPWISRVREFADEVCRKSRQMECDPSIQDIAKEVAKLCEEKAITTAKGKRLTVEYIKRHGLEGWKRPPI